MSTMDDAFQKTPNAVRLDRMIELLEELNKNVLALNKNVAIIGNAAVNHLEKNKTVKAKVVKIIEK